jgi:dihydroflavonol-4-reductase
MKVFVTGGNGFIGSAVVRDLVQDGHDVVCLLRRRSHRDRLTGVPIAVVEGDVCYQESFRRAMLECDAAIHLAAPGGWTKDDGDVLQRVIVGGTRNVLAVAQQGGHLRIIHVSSTAAIASSSEPRIWDETAQFTVDDPTLGYAHAKHAAEVAAREAYDGGVDVVIVNPSEVYGPNDTALGTASNLVDFATSFPVLVCRGGTGVVHVDDVSAGIRRALECGRAGERYILSGENLTIRQLAELVLAELPRRAPIVTIPNALAMAAARAVDRLRLPAPFNPAVVPYATRYWFADNAKARRELGVTFRSARETVCSTLDWLREVGHLRP